MAGMEKRTIGQPVELRAEDDHETITGLAAVFYREGDPGTEYALWDDFVERIDVGAFDEAMKRRDDTRGLFNHDPSLILGRTRSGTMTLAVEPDGLRYNIPLDPGHAVHQTVATHLRRGDVSGSSFMFVPDMVEWERGANGSPDVRWIRSVHLYDVGPVTFPAYESTLAGMRSADAERRALLAERDMHQKLGEKINLNLRKRMLTLLKMGV